MAGDCDARADFAVLANGRAWEEGGVGFYDGVVGDDGGVVDCGVGMDLDVGADGYGCR